MKKAKVNLDLLKDANIPRKFWKLGRKTYFGDDAALRKTEKYIKGFEDAHAEGVGLLFVGPSQSCKTFLATYVLKNLLAKGLQASYFSMDELFELYVGGDSAGENFLSRFREVDCVVIDNVGVTDTLKKGKRNALEKVVSFRSDNGLPYIICTDLEDEQAFAENYGDKVSNCFQSDLVEIACSCSHEMVRARRNEKKLQFMED